MKLNLEQAARDTDLSCQDLLDHIDAGRLNAERKSLEDRTEYLIDTVELSRFKRQLKTNTLFLQPDMQLEDPLPASGDSLSGNLRRVLTAESVAELKIEHKVLSARVETLERLFSEFIEAEREDQTLVLEDAWKIDTHENLSDGTNDNTAQLVQDTNVQKSAQLPPDNVTPSTLHTQDDQPKPTELETTASPAKEMDLDAKMVGSLEQITPSSDTASIANATEEKNESTEKSVPKDAKALMRDKLRSAKTEEHAAPKAKTSTDEQVIEVSDIDLRLAEYERRLAQAKQTATQMWH